MDLGGGYEIQVNNYLLSKENIMKNITETQTAVTVAARAGLVLLPKGNLNLAMDWMTGAGLMPAQEWLHL